MDAPAIPDFSFAGGHDQNPTRELLETFTPNTGEVFCRVPRAACRHDGATGATFNPAAGTQFQAFTLPPFATPAGSHTVTLIEGAGNGSTGVMVDTLGLTDAATPTPTPTPTPIPVEVTRGTRRVDCPRRRPGGSSRSLPGSETVA